MAHYETMEDNRIKMTVTVPADKFADALTKAYIKEGKRYRVPGFRPGKAPMKVIEKAYGEGVFYEEAFDAVYYPAYMAVVKEAELEPVGYPSVDIVTIGHDVDLVFTAEFPVAPTVTVAPELYKGIELTRHEYTVTDAQVDAKVEAELEKNARFVDANRPVEMGDKIILDYSGTVDGVKFEGGTAEGATLDIGSGRFIPGFEEQLVGVEEGGEKEVNVTFPTEYHAKDLAGKAAVFQCLVKEVKKKEMPTLDDEFAKDVSDFDTLAEYKADVRAKLEEAAKRNAENMTENEAVGAVAEKVDVAIPHDMVTARADEMIRDLATRLSYQGLKLEQYLTMVGMTVDQLRDNYSASAGFSVKGDLVLDAIVAAEGLTATDEEVEKEFSDYAVSLGRDLEEVKEMMKDVPVNDIRKDISRKKAIRFIVDNAVLVEKKETKTEEAGEKSGDEAE